MKPSKKLQRYLEMTGNWKFRRQLSTRIFDLVSDVEWLRNRFTSHNYEEFDYLARKVAAQARLLDRLITRKRKELAR